MHVRLTRAWARKESDPRRVQTPPRRSWHGAFSVTDRNYLDSRLRPLDVIVTTAIVTGENYLVSRHRPLDVTGTTAGNMGNDDFHGVGDAVDETLDDMTATTTTTDFAE